jgi:hypothetical protein
VEKKFTKRWSSRGLTIRVTNISSGRVDIHRNISKEEITWISCNPNLEVKIVDDVKFFRNNA